MGDPSARRETLAGFYYPWDGPDCKMYLAYWSPVFALWAIFASAAPKCNPSRYMTVNTSNGPITGHTTDNSSCVVEYLGIPYAKPPINDLRFAPPQRISSYSKTPFEAKEFGYDCPLSPSKKVDYPDMTPQAQRIISYFASAAGTPQSEDCLTLNIWSRVTPNSAKANKPVLVFFYGGRRSLAYLLFRAGLTLKYRICHWKYQQSVLQRQILC